MAKASLTMMWDAFPDHTKYPTLRSVHTYIGGALKKNIDVPGFEGDNGNTCAVRMSRALNYGNFPLSTKLIHTLKLNSISGEDKLNYLFRVRELKIYLASALGTTPVKITKNFASAFHKQKGIVAFDVAGWSNASGHVALWDGTSFLEPDHDDCRKDTVLHGAKLMAMTLWPL